MARLRDIKVGMTVWIKKGRTPVEHLGLFESDIEIGSEHIVTDKKVNGDDLPIKAGWWYPADWISLTPPETTEAFTIDSKSVDDTHVVNKADKPSKAVVEPSKTLYVAYCDGDTTNPGTIDEVVAYMDEEWGWDAFRLVAKNVKFYEIKEVNVVYTPAKFEVK